MEIYSNVKEVVVAAHYELASKVISAKYVSAQYKLAKWPIKLHFAWLNIPISH